MPSSVSNRPLDLCRHHDGGVPVVDFRGTLRFGRSRYHGSHLWEVDGLALAGTLPPSGHRWRDICAWPGLPQAAFFIDIDRRSGFLAT